MNRFKKLLSFVLVLIMLLSVLPLSAIAEEETELPGTEETAGENEYPEEVVDLDEPSGEQEEDSETAPESEEPEAEPEEEPAEVPVFTVVYYSNFNNGSEESSFTQYFTAEDTVRTAVNSFTLAGAGFIGWNTSARPSEQPGTAYGENQEIDTSLYPEGVLSLYAQWQLSDGQLRIIYNPLYSEDLGIESPRAEVVANISELNAEQGAVPFSDPSGEVYTDYQAALILRDAMVKREATCVVTVACSAEESKDTLGKIIAAEAIRHTGNPKEGDYITWQGLGFSSYTYTGSDSVAYTFAMTYVTTKAQEDAVDTKVAWLIDYLGLSSMTSDYQIIRTLHDWMCSGSNITYSLKYKRDALGNIEYEIPYTHTAYGAIVDRECCCQGYSQLFYRIMCELGIDSRVIRGEAFYGMGYGGGHAWNIVQLNGVYYNIDTTWDGASENDKNHVPVYDWFLCGTDFFCSSHYCETFYLDALAENDKLWSVVLDTAADIRCYNMSATDYAFSDTAAVIQENEVTIDLASANTAVFELTKAGETSKIKDIWSWTCGGLSWVAGAWSGGTLRVTYRANEGVGTTYVIFQPVDRNDKYIGMPARVRVNIIDSSQTEGLYTVSYNVNGGTGAPANQYTDADGYVEISKTIPTREGYTFQYWEGDGSATYPESNGWFAPGTGLNLTKNLELTAHWEPNGVLAYFDANGGTCSTAYINIKNGSKYGELPVPTYSGKLFLGWYTTRSGGTLITKDTVVSTRVNHTLYAHWLAEADVPEFTSHPQSFSVNEYEAASFSVTVSGSGYTLQWQKSTDNKVSWTDISKATAATLNMTASEELDGVWFRCVLKYGSLEWYSDPALLTVIIDILKDENFPDSSFLHALEDRYENGLTAEAAAAVTDLDLSVTDLDQSEEKIANLKGIEYFTGLTSLNLSGNLLTAVNLSALTNLEELDISNNLLTAVDLSGLTNIEALDVSGNRLKAADFGALTKLTASAFNGDGQNPVGTVDAYLSLDGKTAICDICTYYNNSAQFAYIEPAGSDTRMPESGPVSCLFTETASGTFAWRYNTGNGLFLEISAAVSKNAVNIGGLPQYVTINKDESVELAVQSAGTVQDEIVREFLTSSISGKNIQMRRAEGVTHANVEFTEYHNIEGTENWSYVTVTGQAEGTDWAIVTVSVGNYCFGETRVRIDVVDESRHSGEPVITGVSLDTKKAVVELYSTDYTRVNVLLQTSWLSGASTQADKGEVVITPEDIPEIGTGASIKSAQFTDTVAAGLFKINVLDDRRLEIVPKFETVQNSWTGAVKLKGSYKSAIAVTVDGIDEPLETGLLTISVKKTVPKLKAAAITFNTKYNCAGTTESISFTGGKVTSVEVKPGKTPVPFWLGLDEATKTVGYIANRSVTGSYSFNLMCKLEGWAVSVPVTLKVAAVSKDPAVKMKASGIIEKELTGSTVALTATAKNGSIRSIRLKEIYAGKTRFCGPDEFFCFNSSDMTLRLTGKPDEVTAGSYKAIFEVTMRDGFILENVSVTFKVKTTSVASLKPKLTLSSKTGNLFLADKYDETVVVIGCPGASIEIKSIELDAKSQTWFEIKNDDTIQSGVCIIGWKDNVPQNLKLNSSKTVKLLVSLTGDNTAKPNATLSYKITVCGN